MLFGVLDRRAAPALLAVALALSACGDDEPAQVTAPAVTGATDTAAAPPEVTAPENEPAPDPATDEAMITATLEAVLVDGDACGDLVTDRYLRRAYGGRAGCEAAQNEGGRARSVRVSRVVVLPDSVAQASAAPVGGVYDGERLRAELILVDGTWRLDSLRSNVPVGP